MTSDGRPPNLTWDYDRAEIGLDAVVHAAGVIFAVAGPVAYFWIMRPLSLDIQTFAVAIYIAGLVTMLCVSAAYNVWPLSQMKWLLRRFDHSAIYLLIAATYTPFVLNIRISAATMGLLTAIWLLAGLGITLKIAAPGRLDRLSIVLYLLLGWSGLLIYRPMVETLPATTIGLLALGGILYSVGVIFHVWRTLRFQNAIWHAFVLLAAVSHFAAVLTIDHV